MKDIKNYLCESEVCIEKVRSGLIHTMAELYGIIGRSAASSIIRAVRDTFFSSNFYCKSGKIIIYFYDELDPDQITDYLMSEKEYLVERQYVYELVCRTQQKSINYFYKQLDNYKKGQIEISISKDIQVLDHEQYKKFINEYNKAFVNRANSIYKRVRRK